MAQLTDEQVEARNKVASEFTEWFFKKFEEAYTCGALSDSDKEKPIVIAKICLEITAKDFQLDTAVIRNIKRNLKKFI